MLGLGPILKPTFRLGCAAILLLAVSALRAQDGTPKEKYMAAQSIDSLRALAGDGDAYAQCELGVRYIKGDQVVTRDYAEAAQWLQKAANQGLARGEQLLGYLYQWGRGVPADHTLALSLYLKSAAQGNGLAELELGNMYERGEGAPQDYQQAREWFMKSAEAGITGALINIGSMYADGLGVPQDFSVARQWYQKAVDAGDKSAVEALQSLNGSYPPQEPAPSSCWSSKFDEITDSNLRTNLLRDRAFTMEKLKEIMDQAGGIDPFLAQFETQKTAFQEALDQGQESVDAFGAPHPIGQLILLTEGGLEMANCMKRNAQSPARPAHYAARLAPPERAYDSSPSTPPARVDVRYLQVHSRPLTDTEMRELRDSLRWEPAFVPFLSGGTARSDLVDDKGTKYGSVLVRWDKPSASKGLPAEQSRAHFTVQVENHTSCVFQSSAEIDDAQGFVVVSSVTWGGWLTLHQPERGQTSQVRGTASLGAQYASMALKPLTAYSTLSACFTPLEP